MGRCLRALLSVSVDLALRPMLDADLSLVAGWLREPHVARWWLSGTTAGATLASYRRRVAAAAPATMMLTVIEDRRPIGWCQWYRWADYPEAAEATGATRAEAGIDYAIGEADRIGRGVGTALVGALVTEVRRVLPGAGLVTAPDAANTPSRRVLEKNDFDLVEVRPIATEPVDVPMAIYRLGPERLPEPGPQDGARGVAAE